MYLYSAHRAVIFATAQLSCFILCFDYVCWTKQSVVNSLMYRIVPHSKMRMTLHLQLGSQLLLHLMRVQRLCLRSYIHVIIGSDSWASCIFVSSFEPKSCLLMFSRYCTSGFCGVVKKWNKHYLNYICEVILIPGCYYTVVVLFEHFLDEMSQFFVDDWRHRARCVCVVSIGWDDWSFMAQYCASQCVITKSLIFSNFML